MEEKVQMYFKLGSIINESTIIALTEAIKDNLTAESVRFQFKVNVEINLQKDIISVTPSIKYKYQETVILESKATFVFDIPELKSITSYSEETEEITLKANIIPTLVAASFSSMRGIIYSETKDSIFKDFPLPLVNMDNLLHKIGISIIE